MKEEKQGPPDSTAICSQCNGTGLMEMCCDLCDGEGRVTPDSELPTAAEMRGFLAPAQQQEAEGGSPNWGIGKGIDRSGAPKDRWEQQEASESDAPDELSDIARRMERAGYTVVRKGNALLVAGAVPLVIQPQHIADQAGTQRDQLTRALYDINEDEQRALHEACGWKGDYKPNLFYAEEWYADADRILSALRSVPAPTSRQIREAVYSACGHEDARLPKITTDQASVIAELTIAFLNDDASVPAPSEADEQLIRNLVDAAETHALSGDGYSLGLNAAEAAMRSRLSSRSQTSDSEMLDWLEANEIHKVKRNADSRERKWSVTMRDGSTLKGSPSLRDAIRSAMKGGKE